MLQLYIQYLPDGLTPLIRDNSCETVAQTIHELDSCPSEKSSEPEELQIPKAQIKKQYSQKNQDLLSIEHELNYDITQDIVNCNILKDYSFLHKTSDQKFIIPPTRMVLGIAIPDGYEYKKLLNAIREYFKQIQYIRIFHDVDYAFAENKIISVNKKQSLIVFVFHEDEQAFMFQKEMNCYLLSYERQEYLYLLLLHKIAFVPYIRAQPLDPDEMPLDIAQQQALLGRGFFTLLPKCSTCLEKIEGSQSGVDYAKQIDLQVIYSNQARWSEQKMICKVCSVVYKDETKLQQTKPICQICGEDQDVWICLICGNIGCGRYKLTHAQGHQLQTNHIFSLELLTGRLWDYNTDNFVHRLLKRGDNGILNLPDSQNIDSVPMNTKQLEEGVEQVILESCYEMTRQMESQRQYYEDQLEKEKQDYEGDLIVIDMNQNIQLVKSYIEQETSKANLLQNKLEEIKKHKKILNQKIKKMDEDIEQQSYFNDSMTEKLTKFANQNKVSNKPNSQTAKLLEEEENKLNQLKQQLQMLYMQFEQ